MFLMAETFWSLSSPAGPAKSLEEKQLKSIATTTSLRRQSDFSDFPRFWTVVYLSKLCKTLKRNFS